MRALPLWLLLVSSTLLSSCSQQFDEGEKNNKAQIKTESDDLKLKLAMASDSGGDVAGAERMYMKVAENGTPQSTIDLASFYTRHNQADRAVTILEEAYTKTPTDLNLMRTLANSLISAGKAEKALALLDGAIAGGAQNAYIYNSRGVALDTLGKYGLAQESYSKAIALNPNDDVDFKTNLSMSYILEGDYKAAIELLKPVVTQKSATPQARQNLALAYGLTGDMETAMSIGTKDASIKEMNENIRFYQHITDRKGGLKRSDTTPKTPASPRLPLAENEGTELPPPPPMPVKNLTYHNTPVDMPAAPPAAPVDKLAPAVTSQQAVQSPVEQNNVKVFTPSPQPIAAKSVTPQDPKPAGIQHKLVTAPAQSDEKPAVDIQKVAPAQTKELPKAEVKKPEPVKPEPKKAIPEEPKDKTVSPSYEEDPFEALTKPSEDAPAHNKKKNEPAKLMEDNAIPTPVLKPDNW